METGTADYARLTAKMGGLDCAGDLFSALRSPCSSQHWTLPLKRHWPSKVHGILRIPRPVEDLRIHF